MKSILIKNVKIFTEKEVINQGSLLIENGTISQVTSTSLETEQLENRIIIDGTNLNLIPGFIDGHIHGAYGADVMDATEAALDTMATNLPSEGTTSFLPTTITQAPENVEKALINVKNYQNKAGQAEIIGIHLEGPFVNKKRAGAQPQQYIVHPNLDLFDKWQSLSGNLIKTITIAPEHDEDGQFISSLQKSGVNVSAGHTDTNFSGMKKAVSEGVRQVTHLCNAMSGIHHRDIGVVGAAFQLEELRAEVICDGIHVSPEMLQLAYNNIGSERLIMITDSMRAKGLEPGDYELGGQPVKVSNGRAVLEDGTLAGSILKMNEGAQQMLQLDGVSIAEIIEMASVNPAKQIGIFDRKGSISIGKDADLLLVDDQFNIQYTICRGAIAYKG
ncbi:N-acetylglucosamine-6-phosphate deacetylase [Robertmurraya yapensis]|uniref:N-acetylglucosamine-6-phosphate deacetylase n=2 Tax=Bacillaceae TaxID=186817 RepID=A0A431W8L9_9BACI|nr:N-acetylglucosamine-6-phosphate deacetylase [Bacillus yapensis]RTR31853.1 N-acetylglucosamine-6-phosphate deacetylase [Bacillus yapensis]TKS95866.1 N-acetylglucosamine-6-phosphate deacetylase [Bacillus yapensis]